METSTLLLVEDEKIIALDLKRSVEKLGYTVVGLASTGEKAIEFLETTRPDLVLMDIMLGKGMNGIECARIIDDEWQIPVIFLTAYADDGILEEAKKAKPYGYIIKPFRMKDLQTTLEIARYKYRSQIADKEKQGFIQAILDNAQEGICTFNFELHLGYMNRTARKMLGIITEGIEVADDFSASSILKVMDAQTLETIPLGSLFPELYHPVPIILDDLLLQTLDGNLLNVSMRVSAFLSPIDGSQQFIVSILDISTQKNMARSIDYQTKHDALTDLPNRAHFLGTLIRLWTSKEYEEKPYHLILINLDKFKIINELAGHTEGDRVLRDIARDLESLFHYHSLARLSSDEFALLVQGTTEQTQSLAEGLRSILERKIPWNKEFFLLTGSIGIVPITRNFADSQTIMAAGDDTIFMVKTRGGNGIEVFNPENTGVKKHRGEMVWINRIISALEDDRFVLYAQPLSPLRKGLPKKKEILIRLLDENQDLVSPGIFIGAAERYKLMGRIDLMVLAKSLTFIQSLENPDETVYCVNLSGTTLQDDSALSEILQLLDQNINVASQLQFEITETAAIQSFVRVIDFIYEVKNRGITFALDDFGNGFSSFAYLKKLPISVLKIDGSYVRDMMQDHTSRAMVAAINTMSHELGMITVAEFVSSQSVLDELITLGVDYAQGYTISEPKVLAV